jgi:hypothetical protein
MDRIAMRSANRETAGRLIEEAKRDPHSPYVGKIVGIANAQIVVVPGSRDELARRMLEAVLDPSTTLSLEVGADYDWRT